MHNSVRAGLLCVLLVAALGLTISCSARDDYSEKESSQIIVNTDEEIHQPKNNDITPEETTMELIDESNTFLIEDSSLEETNSSEVEKQGLYREALSEEERQHVIELTREYIKSVSQEEAEKDEIMIADNSSLFYNEPLYKAYREEGRIIITEYDMNQIGIPCSLIFGRSTIFDEWEILDYGY